MDAAERLSGILHARELRWQCRQMLVQQHGCALLTASLRLPSRLRQEADFLQAFDRLMASFEAQLAPLGGRLLLCSMDADGPARHYAVPDARAAKQLSAGFEEQQPGGAMLDLDVLDADARAFSRAALMQPARACAVCGSRPASACIVGAMHPIDEVEAAFRSILAALAPAPSPEERIAALAVRALLYEAAVSPKPGLVDRQDQGAHQDMDFYSFIDSALALRPWFQHCARLGASSDVPPEALLHLLRPRGILAEQQMLAATGGANTHRGLIFSLGILCAASGRMPEADGETLCQLAAAIAKPALQDPLGDSHGDRVRRRYGGLGVRGEAAQGFPAARAALKVLRAALDRGRRMDEAGRRALYCIMARLEDSNVLHRAGEDGLRYMQQHAEALLSQDLPPMQTQLFEQGMQARGISPGGSADSLALCLYLWLREQGDEM